MVLGGVKTTIHVGKCRNFRLVLGTLLIERILIKVCNVTDMVTGIATVANMRHTIARCRIGAVGVRAPILVTAK